MVNLSQFTRSIKINGSSVEKKKAKRGEGEEEILQYHREFYASLPTVISTFINGDITNTCQLCFIITAPPLCPQRPFISVTDRPENVAVFSISYLDSVIVVLCNPV